MSRHDSATALRRLGLGPKPGEVKRVAGDPRGYVLAQLIRAEAASIDDPELSASSQALIALREARLAQKEAREAVKDGGKPAFNGQAGKGAVEIAAAGAPEKMAAAPTRAATSGDAPKPAVVRREVFAEEIAARVRKAATTDTPFLERLVMFWSNHFCVSAAKGPVRVLAGAYEREVIRTHVLGRFGDMLRASAQHPAMLLYLDNAQSIGPNSKAGQNRGKGLNENLAREILELHTLGVDGGYTQADVTSLARLLTGWTIATEQMPRGELGHFVFAPNRHEPGAWNVLGKRYESGGAEAGERCLTDLAKHPSTARHVARKIAVHFVSETPPPSLVSRLEESFHKTGGDLEALARSLATADEVWREPPRKIVPPYDFAVSLIRGFELKAPPGEVARLSAALGQPLWQPPSPKGWPEEDNAWMGPSAVRERLRIAEKAAREVDRMADPRAVAEDLLGAALADSTRQAVARAETREQGFELLMMAPELLRR